MNSRSFEYFLQFHRNIPRQGPGTREATTEAFQLVRSLLPPAPKILDLGCGSGGQTLVLAGLTEGDILAVDLYPSFLGELRERAAKAGLSHRVTTREGDMNALDLGHSRFDLVWCEGAIFATGFQRGLELIRPWLVPSGVVVLSEAVWLTPLREVPSAIAEFWTREYPGITTIEESLTMAKRAGYAEIGHFTLPREGWDAYVDSVEVRMNEVLAVSGADPDAQAAAEAERREFAVFRENRGWFGYEFFLLRRDEARTE